MKSFIKTLLREELEKYEHKSWAYVNKNPMTLQVYRGDRSGSGGPNHKSKIVFYTTNELVAQTYGYMDKIIKKTLKLNKPYIWEFSRPIEFNEREVSGLISTYEEALIHINETGTDYVFNRYSETYVIPKEVDGIIVCNIVDPSNGCVDVEDEFCDEFDIQMEKYNSEVVMLYNPDFKT
jgi:hypothetical protein